MWTMSRLGAVGTELRRAAVPPVAVFTVPALTLLGDAAGGTPTAAAFSREDLPVEYAHPRRSMTANNLESLAINGVKRFQERYAKAGGSNATFVFPPEGNHSWAYRGQQLPSLEPDLIATLNG
jgi:hypothetical protein